MENVTPLIAHLEYLDDDPTRKIDQRLVLSHVRPNSISPSIDHSARLQIVGKCVSIISKWLVTGQDPTTLTELVDDLTEDDSLFTFDDVLLLQIDFVQALGAELPIISTLVLSLLRKAAKERKSVYHIASHPEIIDGLMRTWLTTTDVKTADVGESVLMDLLNFENSELGRNPAQEMSGLMWRRVFEDKDVYSLFYSICSLSTMGEPGQPNERAKTIAQGRLLSFLVKTAHCPQMWRPHHPTIEAKFGVKKGGGLMEFAFVHMIDYPNDMLSSLLLLECMCQLISLYDGDDVVSKSADAIKHEPHSSAALDMLTSHGLHNRILAQFLEGYKSDDYLYSGCSSYVAAYASRYHTHFVESERNADTRILDCLSDAFRQTSDNLLSQQGTLRCESMVLQNIPRAALIHPSIRDDILAALRLWPPNPHVLTALATIFGSQVSYDDALDRKPQRLVKADRSSARAAYFLYVGRYPTFWDDVITVAKATAFGDGTIAAMKIIRSIAKAKWEPLPETSSTSDNKDLFTLPTEKELERARPTYRGIRPLTGIEAIHSTDSWQKVANFLCDPAPDGQILDKNVAQEKYDALKAYDEALHEWVDERHGKFDGMKHLFRRLAERLRGGVYGVVSRPERGAQDPSVGTISRR